MSRGSPDEAIRKKKRRETPDTLDVQNVYTSPRTYNLPASTWQTAADVKESCDKTTFSVPSDQTSLEYR